MAKAILHLNGDPTDNRPTNLIVVDTEANLPAEERRRILFNLAAESIWGTDWLPRAAVTLALNLRTVRRFKKGDAPIPHAVLAELAGHVQEEARRLQSIAQTLDLISRT